MQDDWACILIRVLNLINKFIIDCVQQALPLARQQLDELKRDLEGWREALLPLRGVIVWEKPYYPAIIFGITTLLFALVLFHVLLTFHLSPWYDLRSWLGYNCIISNYYLIYFPLTLYSSTYTYRHSVFIMKFRRLLQVKLLFCSTISLSLYQ